MAQTPKKLDPQASPHANFGYQLRSRRMRQGLSQAALGHLVHVSGDLIGKIEKADRRSNPDLVQRLDTALDASGELINAARPLTPDHRTGQLPENGPGPSRGVADPDVIATSREPLAEALIG